MHFTTQPISTQAQEIILTTGYGFKVERIVPKPASGEPLMTLEEALQGTRIVSAGDGQAFVYEVRPAPLRIFEE